MSKEKWICGWSEDNWDGYDEFDTKSEAIIWGRSEYESYDIDGFFVGLKRPYKLDDDIINVEGILERVGDDVYSDMGEFADDYLANVTRENEDELEKELNKVFHDWIKKYNYEPTFFEVVDIEGVDLIESEDES